MATHFTYSEDPDIEQLRQGDILKRDQKLVCLLRKHHRHYAERDDYKYFLVLTQSCDLVRRDPKKLYPYVTIAAVRPLAVAIRREAKKHQECWEKEKGVLGTKARNKIANFTSSLLDNNVRNYFYLHEDLSLGISGRNCAFLALSVAIKIEHYDICLKAKIAQLKEPFSLKLGWLVGDMYSRVGTKDWDSYLGPGQVEKETNSILNELFIIIPQEKIEQGKSELQVNKKLSEYSDDEIYERIVGTKLIAKSTQFKERARTVLSEKYPSQRSKQINQTVEALSQDAIIKNILS